ncbi:MAG: hypothetical protein JWM59_892 [Verrucomicrobiales bacterium]|nr:hypothetical protein [Verrucomicrobiales bacterium]
MEKPGHSSRQMPRKERAELLATLKERFAQNMTRHRGVEWAAVEARLESSPEKLWSLHEMERTGGEPDVTGHDSETGEYLFCDCSPESPPGRRRICYDREALGSRKEHRPGTSALDMAAAMGIQMLDEEQYRALQTLGSFDTKTSSWCGHPLTCGNWAVPSSATAALGACLSITTARSPITVCGPSAGCCECEAQASFSTLRRHG